MKLLLFVAILLLPFTSLGQNISKEIFTETVYKNCIDSTKTPFLLSNKSYNLGISESNRVIIFEDLQYEFKNIPSSSLKQLKDNAFRDTPTKLWDCNSFNKIQCVLIDSFDIISHPRFYRFSRPIFDNNKKYALISMGYNCGSLCGYGCTYLFKRKNKKWILVHKFACWRS